MTMVALGVGGVICYVLLGYDGYKIWNFILIYLIGRWIALYFNKSSSKQAKNAAVVLVLSVLLTFCLSIWWIYRGHDVTDKTVFAYCSPWVLMSSVALFIIFKNINITKRWIYYVAPSVLSVYLLHENGLTKQIIYIKPLRYFISLVQSDILAYLSMIVYGLTLFAVVVLFDFFVRRKIQIFIVEKLTQVRIIKIFDTKLLKLNE